MSNLRKKVKTKIIVDIKDDVVIDNSKKSNIENISNTDDISNKEDKKLEKLENLKNLNNLLLIDIDKKDKEIKNLNKKITDICLRNRKKISDNNNEFTKKFNKIDKLLIDYKSSFSYDYIYFKDLLNDLINQHCQNIKQTNSIIKNINDKYNNQINIIHQDYKTQINDIHNDYNNQIHNLKEKHNLHIKNIKTLYHNEKELLDNNLKNLKNIEIENQNLKIEINQLKDTKTISEKKYIEKLSFLENFYNESTNNIKIFENNLINNINSLSNYLKNNRFNLQNYYNVCIYDKDIEYDFEFKKNTFNQIFYNIEFNQYKNYSKNNYISKYLNIIEHIELFLKTDKDFLIYIDKDVKCLYDNDYIINQLNNISKLSFDLILLNSDDNYNLLNKQLSTIKVNNIKCFDSFIVNKKYSLKLLKIISDSINKILKNGFIKEENRIENSLNKLLNDKNCFLYYPQFFKNKNHKKTIFCLLDKNINHSFFGYNFNIVNKTDLNIIYKNNNIIYIPENQDYIYEIIKYHKKFKYDNLLIINNSNIKHNKCFLFINNNINAKKILIDKKTKNLFINFNNDYDYDNLFNQDNCDFINFDL